MNEIMTFLGIIFYLPQSHFLTLIKHAWQKKRKNSLLQWLVPCFFVFLESKIKISACRSSNSFVRETDSGLLPPVGMYAVDMHCCFKSFKANFLIYQGRESIDTVSGWKIVKILNDGGSYTMYSQDNTVHSHLVCPHISKLSYSKHGATRNKIKREKI